MGKLYPQKEGGTNGGGTVQDGCVPTICGKKKGMEEASKIVLRGGEWETTGSPQFGLGLPRRGQGRGRRKWYLVDANGGNSVPRGGRGGQKKNNIQRQEGKDLKTKGSQTDLGSN